VETVELEWVGATLTRENGAALSLTTMVEGGVGGRLIGGKDLTQSTSEAGLRLSGLGGDFFGRECQEGDA